MASAQELLRPVDFLKSIGFGLDEKPHELDRKLLKSFPSEDRHTLREIWAARDFGSSLSLRDMYELPKTRKQAALLFSHDWPRVNASMKWFNDVVLKLAPKSIVEMGCGAGFLLKFIQGGHPDIRLQGVDAARNLIAIASELCGSSFMSGDYSEVQPDQKYDLIVCDFGFDLARFTESSTPHTTASVGDFQYCPGCSNDLKQEFDHYTQAWRSWAHDSSYLAVAGRIGHFGMLRAFVLSAQDVGWELVLDHSAMLKIKHHGTSERFPALLFRSVQSSSTKVDLLAAGRFFLEG